MKEQSLAYPSQMQKTWPTIMGRIMAIAAGTEQEGVEKEEKEKGEEEEEETVTADE